MKELKVFLLIIKYLTIHFNIFYNYKKCDNLFKQNN